jgi:hypothetical protein
MLLRTRPALIGQRRVETRRVRFGCPYGCEPQNELSVVRDVTHSAFASMSRRPGPATAADHYRLSERTSDVIVGIQRWLVAGVQRVVPCSDPASKAGRLSVRSNSSCARCWPTIVSVF